jgi:hypothetical protein
MGQRKKEKEHSSEKAGTPERERSPMEKKLLLMAPGDWRTPSNTSSQQPASLESERRTTTTNSKKDTHLKEWCTWGEPAGRRVA